jgi:pimeloyl-ACP methyl ester carboxylesterase
LYADIYQRPEPQAPILIWNHGAGGYSGLFVTLALAFYDRGYTVVVADLQGHGRTGVGDAKGDFTINGMAQNIADVIAWATQQFRGAIFTGGSSIGSAITFNALGLGAQVEAAATTQFYAFDDMRTAFLVSKFAPLANIPGLAKISQWCTAQLAKFFPRIRLPYLLLAHWDGMLDQRDRKGGFVELWKADPYSPRTITLKAFSSLLHAPSNIALSANRTPWLVVNTLRDQMISPKVTSDTYARLGGPKHYLEMDWGHYSLLPEFINTFAAQADAWFRQHLT